MPTRLYCLLAAAGDSAAPPGTEVRALRAGDIVAWVATTSEARISREGRRAAAEVVRHDRVIAQALARDVTPIPATLADPYPDDAAVVADMENRSAEIRASLARVEGAVEMAIILATRGQHDAEANEGGGPGRQYLENLRDSPAKLAAAADEIDQRLLGMALASARRPEKDRMGLSHLIRRGDVLAYRSAAMGSLSEAYRMVVDGPRAPYSFASFRPSSGSG